MTAISIIAIFIAFAGMIFFAYRGFSTIFLAPLLAIFVALVSGMNIYSTITGMFMQGVSSLVAQLFLIFLLSILFGHIYTVTNAGARIASTLMDVFGRGKSADKQRTIAVYISIFIGFILCYGGIDTFCALFSQLPIIIALQKKTGIPRRYVVALITSGAAAASMCPGAPVVFNYLPMMALGTSTTAGLIPGIIGTIVMILGCGTYLNRAIKKSVANSEVFEYGSMKELQDVSTNAMPSFIVALIPLLLVVIIFNIWGKLEPALCVGVILALALMYRNIVPEADSTKGKAILNTILNSGRTACESIFLVSIIFGFAVVVTSTPGYAAITRFIVSLPIPAPLICFVAIAFLVGLTCAPPAGLKIAAPLLAEHLKLAPQAIHRIIAAGATTLDTMPYAGPILVMLNVSGLSHKEAYKPAFMCSVVMTSLATLVIAVIYILFPMLP